MADKSLFQRVGDWFGGDDGSAMAEDVGVSVEIEKAVTRPTDTLGSSNVSDIGGYVFEFDRQHSVAGQNRWRTFDEMVRDSTIIAAGVRLFLNLLANAEWTINPAEDQEDNPRAQEIADQVYDTLFDMTTSWSSVVRKIAMYRFLGFSLMEWTAKKRDDGSIGFLDIEHRPQSSITRWIRDKSGTVESVIQTVMGLNEVEIPRSKLVYAVDDMLTDSPEGLGLFRHAAPTWERLKSFLELEEVGFETDLRGIPIGRAPLGELKADVEKTAKGTPERAMAEAGRHAKIKPLKDLIGNHIRNKRLGAMLPSDTFMATNADSQTPTAVSKWALELLSGDSTSFPDMAKAITRMTQELARLLGVEHLLLGSDGAGSLALAQSKVGTFYLNLTSTLLDLVEIIERDVIQPLADMNGWPPELVPSVAVSEISDVDLDQVARILASLATAGAPIMADDPIVAEIRDRMGFSRPAEDMVAREMDAALRAAPDPSDPIALEDSPEDQVTKRRILKSRRGMARSKRAAQMRKAA